MTRGLRFLSLHPGLMIDYFSYLLLKMMARPEGHSEFFKMAFKITFSVSCELSQPMGKTEFSSTSKNRTNYVP